MTNLQVIDYIVVDSKSYAVDGDISNMQNKGNKGWKLLVKEQKFNFFIRLVEPCIPVQAEIKSFGTYKVQMILRTTQTDSWIESKTVTFAKPDDSIQLIQFQNKDLIVSRIQFVLENDDVNSLFLGMKFCVIRKKKEDKKTQKKSITIEKNDILKQASKSPYYKTDIFSHRRKNKDLSTEELQDIQLRDALIKIQKQEKKEKSNSKKVKKEQQMMQIQINEDTVKLSEYDFPQFKSFNYEKHKNIFQYVNAGWLLAQQKSEQERGIKPNQRLSKLIQVKHFYQKKICIDPIFGSRRGSLEATCKDLGGQIIFQPADYCLLITNKIDTDCVKKAKRFKNVKILKSEFIERCKRYNAYLDERDYFFKP